MRSVFLHVDVPGQEDNAGDIENFPTIIELGNGIDGLFAKMANFGVLSTFID